MDTYMDPEFWYHKGVVLNKKNSNKADTDGKKDGNDQNARSAL